MTFSISLTQTGIIGLCVATKSYNTARGKGVKATSAALAKAHLALTETTSTAYSQVIAARIQI